MSSALSSVAVRPGQRKTREEKVTNTEVLERAHHYACDVFVTSTECLIPKDVQCGALLTGSLYNGTS